MLALVADGLKPVKLLGPCKRTQHFWPKTPKNTQQCCDLLRPFAWAFRLIISHANSQGEQRDKLKILGRCGGVPESLLAQKANNW